MVVQGFDIYNKCIIQLLVICAAAVAMGEVDVGGQVCKCQHFVPLQSSRDRLFHDLFTHTSTHVTSHRLQDTVSQTRRGVYSAKVTELLECDRTSHTQGQI